jgi:hypothetical protein
MKVNLAGLATELPNSTFFHYFPLYQIADVRQDGFKSKWGEGLKE